MKNLEISLKREYIIAGDISISMQTVDHACNNLTRYQYMLEKFRQFMRVSADFDKHGGCTVMLFGRDVHKYEHADITTVNEKLSKIQFEPLTMTDLLLKEAFEEHREEKAKEAEEGQLHPGTTLFIFTDGEPTNPSAVTREIQQIASAIDRATEFQIVFLIVGTTDEGLKNWLHGLTASPTFKHKIVSVENLDNVDFVLAASGETA